MGKIKVWTRQHKSVLEKVQENGRYIAKRDYIYMDLKEHARLVLEVYDWLVKNSPNAGDKPEDVKNAESIVFGNDSAEQSAKDYYLMK